MLRTIHPAFAISALSITVGVLLLACASPSSSPPGSPAPSEAAASGSGADAGSIWAGVYADDQAERGATAYAAGCADCHGRALEGAEGGPELVGPYFLDLWSGSSLYELYEVTWETMPPDDPESLSAEDTVDLLAFMLRANGAEAGSRPLSSERAALEAIDIQAPSP